MARARIAALLTRAGESLAAERFIERLHARATVTLNFHPDRLGRNGRTVAETIDAFESIAAALLESLEAKREALGRSDLGIAELVRMLSSEPVAGANGRALDAYVEAQVHGEIALSGDVEAVVVDPSFVGTPTCERLLELSSRYGVALRYHPGFALMTGEVPDDFRGPRMVPLAHRVARFCTVDGRLDAATLGRAAESLERDPQAWSDWGAPQETWQHIKQLWHVLVRFGHPLERAG